MTIKTSVDKLIKQGIIKEGSPIAKELKAWEEAQQTGETK